MRIAQRCAIFGASILLLVSTLGARGQSAYGQEAAAEYPQIAAPDEAAAFPCRLENPSCQRDPWPIEWSETGTDTPVQFAFLGPGLTAEDRFVEPVWLVWQWAEGQALLQAAEQDGLTIVSEPELPRSVFGAYAPDSQTLVINQPYAATFTWMVGAVLVHELQHAADIASGAYAQRTYADCIAEEDRAFGQMVEYLSWLDTRFAGLPQPADMIAGHFTPETSTLYNALVEARAAGDLHAMVTDIYAESCRWLAVEDD